MSGVLEERRSNAFRELDELIKDVQEFPINYNHYYTDTIQKRRQARFKSRIDEAIESGLKKIHVHCEVGDHYDTQIDNSKIAASMAGPVTVEMDNFGCEDILDSVEAIYKVSRGQ